MRASTSVSLLALAIPAVQAQGIVAAAAQYAVKIINAAVEFDHAEYTVRHHKTGKYLAFRRGDVTHLNLASSADTISLIQGKKYGQSGVKFDTWSGTVLYGGNDKCAGAQFTNGLDTAMVSYACTVGPNSHAGTDTLEVAKQFWRFVPCGGGAADFTSANTAPTTTAEPVKAAVKLAAVKTTTEAEAKAESTTEAATGTDSAYVPKATREIVPTMQYTWVCQKPGQWLDRHPEYVTELGHVECADDLETYRRRIAAGWLPEYAQAGKVKRGLAKHVRRAGHKATATIEKRASSGRFCIIPEDHLTDMTTRAVSGKVVTTVGDYQSMELVDYDPTDDNQWWDVVKA